ncbi:APC family permease [Fodinicola acaciae]|uniref:APC family permease n=1 Tax=Fodinicola acaciae TaxID=2681555 RepID=UPI001C9E869B|nr:APC family permease [Fodinicola acaciae]
MTSTDVSLPRTLGLRELIANGLLFIGPAAPFSVYGLLDARANGAVATVYLVATIAVAFTAISYAQMASQVPKAGSVSAYAQAGLGRIPGFFAGWMAGLDYLFIPSLAALFTGIATNALVPAIPTWLITGVALVLITGLNIAGAKVAARVGIAVLIIEIVMVAVFVVLAIAVLVGGAPHRPWLSPFTSVGVFALAPVLTAASVAVLSFLGFDGIASFAEDNNGDPKQVSKALLICLAVAGGLFVVQTYLGALLMPVTPEQLAAKPADQGTAFYTMLQTSIAGWFGTTVTVIKAVGPVFAAMVAQAAASRLMYGMSRQGHLPAALGRVNARTRTPVAAILVSAVSTLGIAVGAALLPNGLDLLSSLVTVGALVAFGMLHASVIGYFLVKRRSRSWWPHLVVPVVGALVILAVLVSANPLALTVAAGWLVVGIVFVVVRRNPVKA